MLSEKPANAFEPIVLEHGGHRAQLVRHGGHVLGYTPAGHRPVLWLSDQAVFEEDKAIRGGVPICAPWFGPSKTDPNAPSHGTVRTKTWDLLEAHKDWARLGTDSLGLRFEMTARLLDHLQLSLAITNASDSEQTIEAALHSYFVVGDVRQVKVRGLAGCAYIDQLQDNARFEQNGLVTFQEETDRIYLGVKHPVSIEDPVLQRVLTVVPRGADACVVWNPWTDKSQRMGDFPDNGWPQMLCIETACAADHAVALAPGQTHVVKAELHAMGARDLDG